MFDFPRRIRRSAVSRTLGLVALCVALAGLTGTATAATAPTLGTSGAFAILAGSTITNVAPSSIGGNLGIYPGAGTAYTGFTCSQVNGTIYKRDPTGIAGPCVVENDGLLLGAKNDFNTAYGVARGQPWTLINAELGGQRLVPGSYAPNGGEFAITAGAGALELDGLGNPDSVFIINATTGLTVNSGSRVSLINGAQSCNVFWTVPVTATINTNATFVGTLMAQTSITVAAGSSVAGRLFAYTAEVTLDQDTITRPTTCVTSAQIAAANAAAVAAANAAAVAAANTATAAAAAAVEAAKTAAANAAAAAELAATVQAAAVADEAAKAAEAARVAAKAAAVAKLAAAEAKKVAADKKLAAEKKAAAAKAAAKKAKAAAKKARDAARRAALARKRARATAIRLRGGGGPRYTG